MNDKVRKLTEKVTQSVWKVRLRCVRVIEIDILAYDQDEAAKRAISFADAEIGREAPALLEAQDSTIYVEKLGDVSYFDRVEYADTEVGEEIK